MTSNRSLPWLVNGVEVAGAASSFTVPYTILPGDDISQDGSNILTAPNFDLYISATGNDANDGTPASPWATLGRLETYGGYNIPSETLTLSATSGSGVTASRANPWGATSVGWTLYATTGGVAVITAAGASNICTIDIIVPFASTTPAQGVWRLTQMPYQSRVWVGIEAGTWADGCSIVRDIAGELILSCDGVSTFDGTTVTATDPSCFEALGGVDFRFSLAGHGSRITGYSTTTGNGLGAHNSAMLYACDFEVDNCVDGISGHNSAVMEVHRITVSDCSKSGYQHVQTATCRHYDCHFTGKTAAAAGIGQIDAGCVAEFFDCVFIPATAGQGAGVTRAERCQFGTWALRSGVFLSQTIPSTLIDCFLHAQADASICGLWTRCYGRLSLRLRGTETNPNQVFENCCFVPASLTYFLYADTDSGAAWQGNGYTFRDCIFTGYSGTVFGQNFTSTQFASFNSHSTIQNCCFYNNGTNVNASITVATGSLLADPQIGPANTVDQADYATDPASPCRGAGVGGSNIGFP